MKCAKSEVPCEDCKEHHACPIYLEYLIASNRPFILPRIVQFPHGDEWIGVTWPEHDIREESN